MSSSRSPWGRGRESGRQVVFLGLALALTAVVIDAALVGRVSLFFDLCFVALCLGLALAVRPTDFFTVGLLPPLIMLGVFTMLALSNPGSIARPDDGVVQAVVSGVSQHSAALVSGYLLCLVTLALRQGTHAEHRTTGHEHPHGVTSRSGPDHQRHDAPPPGRRPTSR